MSLCEESQVEGLRKSLITTQRISFEQADLFFQVDENLFSDLFRFNHTLRSSSLLMLSVGLLSRGDITRFRGGYSWC